MEPGLQVDFVAPTDPFDAGPLLRGVMRYSSQHGGWHVRVLAPDTPELPAKLAASPAGGLIAVVEGRQRAMYARLRKPIVSPYAVVPHEVFPAAVPDDPEIGRLAARHLLAQGFRRLAFYGANTTWSLLRVQGFAEVVQQAGWEVTTNQDAQGRYPHDWAVLVKPSVMASWLRSLASPIAILAANDGLAATMINVALSEGRRVPEDVAVIGVDNQELQCHLARVPLSSVDRNAEGVGYASAELLHRLMRGRSPPPAAVVVAPRGVVVRRSTEMLTFDDPHVTAAVRFIRAAACTSDIGVDDVVARTDVSRSWLERRFRDILGRAPAEEIRRVRLERARQLLLDTELELTDIAVECRFKYLSHLSAAFRRAFGVAPSVYRAKHRRL